MALLCYPAAGRLVIKDAIMAGAALVTNGRFGKRTPLLAEEQQSFTWQSQTAREVADRELGIRPQLRRGTSSSRQITITPS